MAAATMPVLQIRNSNGGAWCVHAEFPDGTFEDVTGFKSENDANEWIAKDLQHWLDQRKDKHSCNNLPSSRVLASSLSHTWSLRSDLNDMYSPSGPRDASVVDSMNGEESSRATSPSLLCLLRHSIGSGCDRRRVGPTRHDKPSFFPPFLQYDVRRPAVVRGLLSRRHRGLQGGFRLLKFPVAAKNRRTQNPAAGTLLQEQYVHFSRHFSITREPASCSRSGASRIAVYRWD